MPKTGLLNTDKNIEDAITDIKQWLGALKIDRSTIVAQWDAGQNVAVLNFKYSGKEYQFRSTRQKNCRLNMHAIAKVIEFKVRAQMMNIEDFTQSMSAYLSLDAKGEFVSQKKGKVDEIAYATLGLTPYSSNEEISKAHKFLLKQWHPDKASSPEAKKAFEKKAVEYNNAYNTIVKERGLKNTQEEVKGDEA